MSDAGEKQFDVLAIGNAMIDILIKTDDAFLDSLGLKKGSMSLIDKDKAKKLADLFVKVEKSAAASINQMSGGCAANVAAGISSFKGKASFLGKIAKDDSGKRFIDKLKERDIDVESSPMVEEGETGQCLVIVTEDGARTMCTYLGSQQEITKEEIKEDLIKKSKIIFLSAFLWDCKSGKEVGMHAIELAKKNNCKVALTLSDYLCVERHKADMIDLVDNHVDILFANKKEINALFGTDDHAESVKQMTEKYKGKDKIAALTCSADGVIVINKDAPVKVAGEKVENIKDTTGAGAIFVSGFLYAYTHGFDLEKAAKLGNLAASECLSHLGARPLIPLKDLIAKI